MLEMWGGVSGGQAGTATPDGGSGAQGRKQAGEEAVVCVNVKVNVNEAEQMKLKMKIKIKKGGRQR